MAKAFWLPYTPWKPARRIAELENGVFVLKLLMLRRQAGLRSNLDGLS
jgi:hypothetical protein